MIGPQLLALGVSRLKAGRLLPSKTIEQLQRDAAVATQQLTRENAEPQRIATAMRMGSLAAAAHHAAGDLDEQFPQAARYMREAASGFERFSNLLRDPNLDEVATLISNLGRKQPAAIVAGVVLIGLGLSWYLKNSGDATHHIAPAAASGEGSEGAYGIH